MTDLARRAAGEAVMAVVRDVAAGRARPASRPVRLDELHGATIQAAHLEDRTTLVLSIGGSQLRVVAKQQETGITLALTLIDLEHA